MACFWMHQQQTLITIPKAEEADGVTYYKINVKIENISWNVSHRYSDFYELHNQLVNDNGLSKDILPPKKLLGNKEPAFVESRRQALEKYLQDTFCYLRRIMPRILVEFLHFHKYEISSLLQALAFQICSKSDDVLEYTFSPIELHAMTEILKNPHPGFEKGDIINNKYDIGHVFDFCSKLTEITIKGSPSKYLESDIITNKLPFDLSTFKALKTLNVNEINLENVLTCAETARKLVQKINCQNAPLMFISQLLQCDVLHKSSLDQSQIWTSVTELDLSYNHLSSIDQSISLVPLLKRLNLSNNQISVLDGLSNLSFLMYVDVSNNLLSYCEDLKTKLPHVKEVNFSQNALISLNGFKDMNNLETLDISFNRIEEVQEVSHISNLISLKNLILTGNPVATTVEYRLKVLEHFGSNSSKLWLDNEKTSQAEVDKVQLLCALRIVKEGKIPNLHSPLTYKR